MTGRRAIVAAALLALLGSSARADELVPPLARQLSDRGRALHGLGDYPHAIVAYKRAYAIAPTPGLLFNLAQAYRLLGECEAAVSYYRRFLSTGPEPALREIAERHLACGSAPAESTALATSVAADPDQDLPSPGRGKRRLGLELTAGGGLVLAAGVYFALDARSASDQVTSAYATGAAGSAVAPIDERGRRSSALAIGLTGVGGAAVVVGVVLYLLGRHDEHAAAVVPDVTIAPAARGALVELAWRL